MVEVPFRSFLTSLMKSNLVSIAMIKKMKRVLPSLKSVVRLAILNRNHSLNPSVSLKQKSALKMSVLSSFLWFHILKQAMKSRPSRHRWQSRHCSLWVYSLISSFVEASMKSILILLKRFLFSATFLFLTSYQTMTVRPFMNFLWCWKKRSLLRPFVKPYISQHQNLISASGPRWSTPSSPARTSSRLRLLVNIWHFMMPTSLSMKPWRLLVGPVIRR